MQRRAQRIHTLSDGDINKGHSMTVSTQRKSNETLKTKIGLLGAHDVSSTSCSESSTQLGASLSMEADDGDGDELRQGLRRSVPSKRSGRTRTIRRTLSRSLSRLSSLAIILMLSKIDSGLATELDSRSSLRMQQLRGLQNITIGPTMSPILSPSKQPSALPTTSPSDYPTVKPTVMPSQWPSHSPTRLPSPIPSSRPSHIPSLLPSSLPTLRPTSTQLPTHDPSQSPSSRPSYQPSQHPTASPTFIPTFTNQPSVSPTLSTIPTAIPSSSPTSKPSGVPSMLPTRTPSNTPSVSGRPSNIPTNQPTVVPTLSKQPSDNPTSLPTSLPTNIPSWRPSYAPSSKPTVTMMPSASPTGTPSSTPSLSMQPSSQPTQRPTAEPTYTEEIVSKATFIQIFVTNSPIEENTTEATLFEKVMESFTPTITDVNVERISTTCLFLEGTKLNRRKLRSRTRGLQIDNDAVQVTYSMTYSSKHVNVTDYNQLFKSWVNSNLDNVTLALQNAAVDVISTDRAYSLGETDPPTRSPTESPTVQPSSAPSVMPTASPTDLPTLTPSTFPSGLPSETPSNRPSVSPSISPTDLPSISPTEVSSDYPSISPTDLPTMIPSVSPSDLPTDVPSDLPSVQSSISPTSSNNNQTATIAAVAGSISAGALIFFMGFCLKRRRQQGEEEQEQALPDSENDGAPNGGLRPRTAPGRLAVSPLARFIPPFRRLRSPRNVNRTDSALFPVGNADGTNHNSNSAAADQVEEGSMDGDSLISTGSSRENESDSDIEYDDTLNLADEFDKYKDQNLEKMRSEVEGMSSNFDGMMSQALTKALMDDMDEDVGNIEEMSIDPPNSMEIEASVLCDMNDWLKQREKATADERREFMQETLNEMVSKVRRGLMPPEDASRTIHGSAAMLGLQLAENLPETVLIVTGMRKQVTKEHVIKAFKEFGEIENAGVSSNKRGFGIVRYRSPKSVENAMEKFRYGEIVVQDVGVMVRVLKADNMGADSKNKNERRSR